MTTFHFYYYTLNPLHNVIPFLQDSFSYYPHIYVSVFTRADFASCLMRTIFCSFLLFYPRYMPGSTLLFL